MNEEENIANVIEGIEKLGINDMDVIVLDASKDRTPRIVEELSEKYGNITLIRRHDKDFGKAIRLGLKLAQEADYDLIVTMDADRSHKPAYIPVFFDLINSGDVVIGSRYVSGGEIKGWALTRRLTSRIANFLARVVLGLKIGDITTNFRCYRKNVIHRILPRLNFGGYVCEVEIIYHVVKNGFRVIEVPIQFVGREKGRSKLLKSEYLRFLWSIFSLRLSGYGGSVAGHLEK